MSFCRWSSDDFQCDLYVYYSVGDFYQIMVANGRHVFDGPLPPKVPLLAEGGGTNPDYWERHRAVDKMLERARIVDIGLPHGGESYALDTAEECAVKMEWLRDEGYNVPQYAIDAVREDGPSMALDDTED